MTTPVTPATRTPMSRRVSDAVPFGLWVTGALAAIVILAAGALWVLGRALAPLSSVIVAITIALLLTALLAPLHERLRSLGVGSYLSATLSLVFLLLVLTAASWLTGAQVAGGAEELIDSASAGLDSLQNWLQSGPLGISGDQLAGYIASVRDWATNNASSLASGAVQAGLAVSQFSVVMLLALVTVLFFLGDGRRIWLWFVRLLPVATQQPTHDAFRRGWVAVRAYVRTQIIVAAVDALGIGLGALILGLPLVVPIMVLTFLMAFIPVVGAVLSGVVAVLIAFASDGVTSALIMIGIVLAVQQLESNVLQPMLMSKAVDLHPWAVIIGVTVFSYLWGIMGALLSVPIMAMAKIIVLTLRGHDPYPELGSDPVGPYKPPPEIVDPAPESDRGQGGPELPDSTLSPR